MLEKEVWKAIPGYVGLYKVSSHGRVKSLSRAVKKRNGTLQKVKGKILTSFTRDGYHFVVLFKGSSRKDRFIHTLVALAFTGPRPEGKKGENIRHLDSNRSNNHCNNLVYGSCKANSKDQLRADTNTYGERNSRAKLTFEQVGKARKLRATTDLTIQELADEFKISCSVMHGILKGKVWSPEKLRLNIQVLKKEGKINEAKRIKRELKVITPIEWVEYIRNTNF